MIDVVTIMICTIWVIQLRLWLAVQPTPVFTMPYDNKWNAMSPFLFPDVDECLLRNGHGPCQGSCANTWGGYKCSCAGVPGTRLAEDGHTCDDVDECRDGTAGCSHQCINTTGSAFCVCPDGLRLDDDWKTCVDVDECSDPELQQPDDRCADRGSTCLNTYGSYRCAWRLCAGTRHSRPRLHPPPPSSPLPPSRNFNNNIIVTRTNTIIAARRYDTTDAVLQRRYAETLELLNARQ